MRATLPLRSLVIAALLLIAVPPPALAQPAESFPESLSIGASQPLEILAASDIPGAQYRWVLTQDRAFLQAEKTPYFRTRLPDPGVYTLNVDLRSIGGTSIQRRFRIEVIPQVRQADTPANAGLVSVDDGMELVTLTPLRSDVTRLHLDLFPGKDGDGDGNPSNDNDAAGTSFEENLSPLTLWFAVPPKHRISLSALLVGGSVMNEALLVSSPLSNEPEALPTRSGIDASQKEGATAQLSFIFPAGQPPNTPLLYHWDLGDGSESLEESPLHTFSGTGTFTVALTIRNLLTGKVFVQESKNIVIEEIRPLQETKETKESQESEETASFNIPWGWIAGVFGLLILLGGGAAMAVFLMKKIGRGGVPLSEKLAAMEAEVVGKTKETKESKESDESKEKTTIEPQAAVTFADAVAQPSRTMAAELEAAQSSSPARDEWKPAPQAVQELKIEPEKAPAWLAKGLEKKEENEPTPPSGLRGPGETETKESEEPAPVVETAPVAPANPVPEPAAEAPAPEVTPPVSEPTPPAPEPAPEEPKVAMPAPEEKKEEETPIAFIRAEGIEDRKKDA